MSKRLYILLLCAAVLVCAPAKAEVGETWEVMVTYTDNPFNGREGVALGEFQGKFWGTGGRKLVCACPVIDPYPCCGYEYTYYDDLWVSEDGRTWELVHEHAPFLKRYLANFFVYNENLYISGGAGATTWRSTDGLTWEYLEGIWSTGLYPPLIFKNKIFLPGSTYYSEDGINLLASDEFAGSPFDDVDVFGLDAVVHGDHIYAFQSQRVWRSSDGYAWTELEGNTDILLADYNEANLAMASFAGYLWIGGNFGTERSGGGSIARSIDGENWAFIHSEQRNGFNSATMAKFKDRLFIFGQGPDLFATQASCRELELPGHSSDTVGCGGIELGELLRMVQFFSYGSFHCDASSEDGYAPGPVPEGEAEGNIDGEGESAPCLPHSSDYAPQDWHISLNELLRLIQLYNADSYAPCNEGESSEDGFCISD